MKALRLARRVGSVLLLGFAAIGVVALFTTPLPGGLVLACALIGAAIGALARGVVALDKHFEGGERFVLGAIAYAVFSFGVEWATRRVPPELDAHRSDPSLIMVAVAVGVYLLPSALRWSVRRLAGHRPRPAEPRGSTSHPR